MNNFSILLMPNLSFCRRFGEAKMCDRQHSNGMSVNEVPPPLIDPSEINQEQDIKEEPQPEGGLAEVAASDYVAEGQSSVNLVVCKIT